MGEVTDVNTTSESRTHKMSCGPPLSRQQQFRETNSLLSELNNTATICANVELNQQLQCVRRILSNDIPAQLTESSANSPSERKIQSGG